MSSIADRFWAKVDKTDGCWNWTGASNGRYGQFFLDGQLVRAHRFSYELEKGSIPKGLALDHLCRNTRCVKPEHLEAVTTAVNNRRQIDATRGNSCRKRGHPLTSENTYISPAGLRVCIACRRMNKRARATQKRASA